MANSVEDALNRASADQRERALATIEEARRNIQSSSAQQFGDISSTDAAGVTKNAQIIEEAKRTIPAETMKDVNEISPPMNTAVANDNYKSNAIELDPNTQNKVEQIQQGEGNNYMNYNAVDRAMERQPQQIDHSEQEQQQDIER